MILDDLLARFFYIVGDNIENPREFSRSRAIDLINEGNSQFRRVVEDEWYRRDIGAVSGQSEYSLPGENVRVLRIAWDDSTMRPRTVMEWVALDDRWERRSSPDPEEWTTQGVAHNKFKVYPEPNVTSSEAVTQTGEYGTIVRWVEDGVDATFTSELGVVVAISTVDEFTGELGIVQTVHQDDVDQFTVWGVKSPETLSEGGQTIPIKNAYQKAGLWYALWNVYEEEGDHHNGGLAGYYKARFDDEVERGRKRAFSPLPWLVMKLGRKGRNVTSRAYLPMSSEMTVDGLGTITVGWPKRGYWS